MARLPTPGGDNGNWGDILNEYLSQAHDGDGTLKDNVVVASNLASNSVTNAAIASDAVNATSIADGSITEALLSSGVQTKLNAVGTGNPITSTNITDSTTMGRSVLTATDATAARTAIGAGTSNLTIGTTGSTAAAGNDTRLSDTRTPTDGSVSTAKIQDTAITEAKLDSGVTTKLNQAAPTWTTISGKPTVIAAGADQAAARTAIGAVGKGELIINVKDYGAVGDGVTNDTAALQNAFTNAPDGATLLFPTGRYYTTSAIGSTGKTLNIEAFGATLIRAGTGSAIYFEGGFDATITVSSLTETTTTIDEATGVLTTSLTLASAPGWARGDLVKLVADDEIPGVRPLGGTNLQRVGQHFFVYFSSGTTVVLVGRVRDPFTTNLRIARMKQLTTRINGLHIESPNPFDGTGNFVRVSNMVRPRVNVTMGSFPSTGLAFKGCYAPQCNLVADCSNDAPTSSKFGYALNDGGSEFGVFHVVAANVRHAYTDGSSEIAAGEASLGSYGRPYGHVVSGTAYGTFDAGWSPHNSAKGIVFRNAQAFNCQGGFALRGVECSVIGGVVENCGYGLTAQDEDGKNGITSKDSYNYGHYIDGLVIRRPQRWGIDVTANLDGPLSGVRETRPTTIRNVTIVDCPGNDGYIVRVANQTVVVDSLYVISPAAVTDHYGFRVVNSDLQLSNITLDYRAHTSGTVYYVYDITAGSPSVISIKDLTVKLTTAAAALVTSAFRGQAATHWDIARAEFSQAVTVISTGQYDASSAIRWLNKSDGSTEGYLSISGTNIESTTLTNRLCISDRPLIVGRCAPSGASRTLAKLGTGKFVGQELIIANVEASSGYTVTVLHSNSSRLTWNIGDTSVVLNNLQYAKWVWAGSYWIQTLAPTGLAH